MNWSKKVTIWILIAVAVLLIGWDIYAAWIEPTDGDTISEVLLWASQRPIIPFGFGVLAGHLFWPQYRVKQEKE